MLANRNSDAVKNIINMFEEAGYNVSLTKINAKDYGCNMKENEFLYGFRDDLDIGFVFPDGSTKEVINKNHFTCDIIWDLQDYAVPANEKNKHNPDAINNNEYFIEPSTYIYEPKNRVKEWDEQAYTVQAFRQCQLHPQAPKMVKVGKRLQV